MKKEEYIERNIILDGYGRLEDIILNEQFFAKMEELNGEIEDVIAIRTGTGGIVAPFGRGIIRGCFIIFKSGVIMCAESDCEYVDLFGS